MCLAIPALITEKKSDNLATAEILGVTREVALDLTPQANVGDYVLVHLSLIHISEPTRH